MSWRSCSLFRIWFDPGCKCLVPVAWTCITLLSCLSWGIDWLTGWRTTWPFHWPAPSCFLVAFPDTAPLVYVGLLSDLCICCGGARSSDGGVLWSTSGADKKRGMRAWTQTTKMFKCWHDFISLNLSINRSVNKISAKQQVHGEVDLKCFCFAWQRAQNFFL